MIMNSKILRNIKVFKISIILWVVYYLLYNTILGWNEFPESDLEFFLDNITIIWGGINLGILFVTFISFMELVVLYIMKEVQDKQEIEENKEKIKNFFQKNNNK